VRFLLLLLVITTVQPGEPAAAPRVLVVELDDTIQPASLRYVERGRHFLDWFVEHHPDESNEEAPARPH
jgi:membrane-bound ClpP family serine protease